MTRSTRSSEHVSRQQRPALGPLFALAAALVAAGCTTIMPTTTTVVRAGAPGPAGPAGAASAPFAAVATPPRPDPSAPKPFDEVIKGATHQAGFVPVWRKDEKVWLEIPAERLNQPFMLSVNIASSVGERGLYASQMGPSWLASFRKINNNQIQLIALNTDYVANNAPMRATVEQSFSQSLLGSSAIVSAPHPDRKSVLIDASFLLSDIAGYSTALEQAYRIPLGLDRGNSYFEASRVTDDLTTLNTRLHYATARIPAPPLVAGPVAAPPPPSTTPDPRSLFVGYVYNFSKMPEQLMPPRRADPRLGHFSDVVTDYSNDLKVNPRQHFIKRWRLEKSDPTAALSEPKQPIVFWMDRNIPVKYRPSVEAGILEWNKAFEKIGFKNAIVAKQQPDDADWDNMDARHASIRWIVGVDAGFARGPSLSDPRTGEILDADISMSDVFGRSSRRFIVEDVMPGQAGPTGPAPVARALLGSQSNARRQDMAYCDFEHEAAHELEFALDVLEARGDIEPDSPQAEAYVRAVIRSTIMHEVGHTLGLKHNFKGSTVYTRAQLDDKDFTEKNSITGSVMDYTPVNLALTGEKQGTLEVSTIGPYDYWAIEYAYKEMPRDQEDAELKRIASRSTEPLLAYSDDTEAGGIPGNDGIDPLVNRFDLGSDPLAYYQQRLQLSRELWQRIQDRGARPGDDPLRQRRALLSGFRQLSYSAELVGKYVGGMNTVRDLPGTTGRASFTPVDPAKQRDALRFLAKGLFTTDSFRFRPEFLTSLSPDFNEWERGGLVSVPAAVLQVQSLALNRLMSPGTASRLLDLPAYVGPGQQRNLISLPEVYGTLQDTIWSELKAGTEIDRLRRNLQREHLRRVQALLVRGAGSLPPDALSLVRLDATRLQTELRVASANPKLSALTRAHLQDSLSQVSEALRASMERSQ